MEPMWLDCPNCNLRFWCEQFIGAASGRDLGVIPGHWPDPFFPYRRNEETRDTKDLCPGGGAFVLMELAQTQLI